jgi:hypothetical protein
MKKVSNVIIVLMMVQLLSATTTTTIKKAGATMLSKISQVTVYPDRAMVTRELKQNLSPGRHLLEFSGLPVGIDDRSARVKGQGMAVATILDVSVKRAFPEIKPRTDLTELEQQKENIQKELRTLADKKDALKKKEKFLEQLMQKTLDSITLEKNPKPLSLVELKKMSDFQEERLNQLYKAKRGIAERVKLLKEENRVLDEKIDWAPSGQKKEQKSVFVDVYVKKTGNLKLSLSYIISGASWAPTYDLRVGRPGEMDKLTYSAVVNQTTGEDWKNVKLTLSTAKPMEIGRVPVLKPIYLDLLAVGSGMIMGSVTMEDGNRVPGVTIELTGSDTGRRVTISDENGKFALAALPPGKYSVKARLEGFKTILLNSVPVRNGKVSMVDILMSTAAVMEEVVLTGKIPVVDMPMTYYLSIAGLNQSVLNNLHTIQQTMIETSDLKKLALSTSFKVRHLQTVISGKGNKKMAIVNKAVPVEKEYVSVPSCSPHVILKAKVKNTSDAPLLTGNMNLFFEGSYVNTTPITFRNPGESFEIPLGIDKGIKVERKVLKEITKKSKKSGFPMGYTIEVNNLKQEAVTLVVLDQIPVSKNKKVKVIVAPVSPKVEKATEEESLKGILTWKLYLKPKEKKTIRVKYLIKYPKGSMLEES